MIWNRLQGITPYHANMDKDTAHFTGLSVSILAGFLCLSASVLIAGLVIAGDEVNGFAAIAIGIAAIFYIMGINMIMHLGKMGKEKPKAKE